MEAKVIENGEITVVHLQGKINYQYVDPFRTTVLESLTQKKVVFNLARLSFVGSSGITTFVDTIEELAEKNTQGLKLCSVGSEFKKVFAARESKEIEIFEEQVHAERAFYERPQTVVEEMVPRRVREGFTQPITPSQVLSHQRGPQVASHQPVSNQPSQNLGVEAEMQLPIDQKMPGNFEPDQGVE